MGKSSTLPNIFAYRDVGTFLKDVFASRKARNPRFTLGAWSRRLKIEGNGTLSNFISGRRVPSPPVLKVLKQDLDLAEYQAQYFDALVVASLKDLPEILKSDILDKLDGLRVGEDYRELPFDLFSIISDPLYLVLREAVKLRGFRWESEWIIRNLRLIDVSPTRVEIIFQSLLSVGLLRWEKDRLIQDDRFYKTPTDGSSEAMKLYYEASMEYNRKAVRSIPANERHFNSITICCSSEDLAELKKLIHDFSRKAMERFDRAEGERVYQLHTQLVPHMITSEEDSI